jgi:hypothetical protein
MTDHVAWSELAPYFRAEEIDSIRRRVSAARDASEQKQLVDRMGEIARLCCGMDTSTFEGRERWLALQHEFTGVQKRLNDIMGAT